MFIDTFLETEALLASNGTIHFIRGILCPPQLRGENHKEYFAKGSTEIDEGDRSFPRRSILPISANLAFIFRAVRVHGDAGVRAGGGRRRFGAALRGAGRS